MNEHVRSPTPEQVEALVRESDGTRRRRLRAVAWATAALVPAALAWMVWILASGGSSIQYVTEPVIRSDLTVTVTATGSVQPTNKVEISSELSGTVHEVRVDYNSPVHAGGVLAVLDTDKLEATVASSRARLEASRARWRFHT